MGVSEVENGETKERVEMVKLCENKGTQICSTQSCKINSLDLAIYDYKILLKHYKLWKSSLTASLSDQVKSYLSQKLKQRLDTDCDPHFTSHFLLVKSLYSQNDQIGAYQELQRLTAETRQVLSTVQNACHALMHSERPLRPEEIEEIRSQFGIVE